MDKKIKYLRDQEVNGRYVKAWKEGREVIVQVWNTKTPSGEPAGDWAMPAVLGIEGCVAQAILQTPEG